MRILVAHNSYQQVGGEDHVVAAEIAMLEAHGHEVVPYRLSNHAVEGMSRLALGARTIWSRAAFLDVQRICRAHRPHLVHFHNTLPLISPAAYYAARAEGVAVVQTLHNFRVCCINSLLFRQGRVCEECLGRTAPWPGVLHNCYRGSRAAGAAITAMIAVHRALGTWHNAVDAYIALSESSRCKFVQGRLPAERITVKPNFVYPDPGPGSGLGGYALFVGRLSGEKGVPTLLEAWRRLDGVPPLKIVGDGPLAAEVAAAARAGTAEWLRELPHDAVYRLLGEAAFTVLPSQCYENFPLVIIEAFARGTPVIVSRLGAMAEIVEDGRTGLHFRAGDPDDLAFKVRALAADPAALARMRTAARETFERKFTAAVNHKAIMAIYARACARAASPGLPESQTCTHPSPRGVSHADEARKYAPTTGNAASGRQ